MTTSELNTTIALLVKHGVLFDLAIPAGSPCRILRVASSAPGRMLVRWNDRSVGEFSHHHQFTEKA